MGKSSPKLIRYVLRFALIFSGVGSVLGVFVGSQIWHSLPEDTKKQPIRLPEIWMYFFIHLGLLLGALFGLIYGLRREKRTSRSNQNI
jgi:membrane associated rhomboid family serine protease